jgi:hypothetical protein
MHPRAYPTILLAALLAALVFALPASGADKTTGGAAYEPPPHKAKIVNGKAIAPADAPKKVRQIINAANKIVRKPYHYGGGHGRWNDSGYDCSGAVSFALHGAHLLGRPMNSSELAGWGKGGAGKWVTVYANGGHAFMVVAGLRFDTGYRTDYAARHGAKSGSGPRWDKKRSTSGFAARHPSHL